MVTEIAATAKELIRSRGRRRKQHRVGSVVKIGAVWYVRFYTGRMIEHTKRDGSTVTIRELKNHRLGSVSELTKDQAEGAAEKYLRPMIGPRGIECSSVTVGGYYRDVILPWFKRSLKPSTIDGYARYWKVYIEPELSERTMREFTTVDAGNFLDGLALKGLNAVTIGHARNVVNRIFAHAAVKGIISANPFSGAVLTEKAAAPRTTYKYTMLEVHDILLALRGNLKAQTAVGLCYFAGLRPGEARATRWENYDGATLRIEQSVWRKHITTPKTRESVAVIPVVAPLRELLSRLREEQGNSAEGCILRGETGAPLNLDSLGDRVIRPTLNKTSSGAVSIRAEGVLQPS